MAGCEVASRGRLFRGEILQNLLLKKELHHWSGRKK